LWFPKNKGLPNLAVQKLGFESITARVVNTVTQKDETLAIQLTENHQREELFQF
jgi:hypothetical protein